MKDWKEKSYDERLAVLLENKKVLILGFGMEGKSSYRFLSGLSFPLSLSIADKQAAKFQEIRDIVGEEIEVRVGDSYLDGLDEYDLIIKSPGIPMKDLKDKVEPGKISSQTDLFLRVFDEQIIGVTGTKGKSTTSTLIYELLSKMYSGVVLLGNIGRPPLDFYHKMKCDSIIIFEMSSHQLEILHASPNIALILNLFEEHLDHYLDKESYFEAKLNIARFQKEDDIIIYNEDDEKLLERLAAINSGAIKIPVSRKMLPEYDDFFKQINNTVLEGKHNRMNLLFLLAVARIFKIQEELVLNTVNRFRGLPHRLQYVGESNGIIFYDDSISTIPEATMVAVETLKKVETIIIGGKDRGISYEILPGFFKESSVKNIILVGETRTRLEKLFSKKLPDKRIFSVSSYEDLPEIIFAFTHKGNICLLSPAASSYDMFENFEQRGQYFQDIVLNYSEV